MADLDKFQRSRNMISEVQKALVGHATGNDAIASYIETLKRSIKIIDSKIEEYKVKEAAADEDDMLAQDDQSDSHQAA